jgi:hypothetical protein
MNVCMYEVRHHTSHSASKPMIMTDYMNKYNIKNVIKINLNVNVLLFLTNRSQNI